MLCCTGMSEWVNERVSLQGKLIVSSMECFNVKKKCNKKKAASSLLYFPTLRLAFRNCLAARDCYQQSCTAQFNAISVPPSLQCQCPTKKVKSSFTELRLTFLFFCHSTGRNPKLWNTLLRTFALSTLNSPSFDFSFFLFFLWRKKTAPSWKNTSMLKKSASRFQLYHECLHNLICPCMMFVSLYYVKTYTGWDDRVHKSQAEYLF